MCSMTDPTGAGPGNRRSRAGCPHLFVADARRKARCHIQRAPRQAGAKRPIATPAYAAARRMASADRAALARSATRRGPGDPHESRGSAVDLGATRGIERQIAAPPTVALCGCASAVSGVSSLTLVRITVDSAMRAHIQPLRPAVPRRPGAMGAVSDQAGLRLPLAAGAVAMLALPAWTAGRLPRLATAFEARG